MEALTVIEIKKTLRGCAVSPADVLAARTKIQLLELAKVHGIGPDVRRGRACPTSDVIATSATWSGI